MNIVNSKKKRNEPMPYQCTICSNYKAVEKEERDTEKAENNKCFELRVIFGKPYVDHYKPFTNSKKEIETTCKNFSHLRSLKMW